MTPSTMRLLGVRRFLPLFVTQFLGAANDNLYKNAIGILIIYRLGTESGISSQILVTLAAGLFILPYLLFSSLAGELADRYEKSGLMKIIKFAEIVIAALGTIGLYAGNAYFLLAVLFLFGVQSAFFGPLKYAVLPEHLRPEELIGGNALIEGGTFLAILLGTIVGGVIILTRWGIEATSLLMLGLASAGFAASLFLPPAHAANPTLRIRADLVAGTLDMVKAVTHRRDVYLSVLGISWFWAMGATFLAEFPALAKDVLGADEHAVTLMLAAFSVGIGAGSLLCARLLKGEVSARYVPLGAFGMTLFSFDLYIASATIASASGALADLPEFFRHAQNWHVLADLLMIAICGGIFIVPLYAILQSRTEESERARAIAANNIMNAVLMIGAAVIAAGMLAAGLSIPAIFLTLAIANTAVALYSYRIVPRVSAQ